VCISAVLWWVEEGRYVVGGYGGVPLEVGQRFYRGWTEVRQRLKKINFNFLKG